MSHIVDVKGVWLDYTDIENLQHTMHVVEWLNGEGVDVSVDTEDTISLSLDQLRVLSIGANCLGMIELDDIKKESRVLIRDSDKRKEDIKRIREGF